MNWQQRPYPALLFILLLTFGLRLAGLDSQSLWWDELKTVQRAGMSFSGLMADLAGHRAHLPLYFLLMQLWHGLGESAFVVRYFSLIWGVVGVAGIFQLGRQIASHRVGLLAALLLAISPFHIWYSQEARMYSLLPALLILAHWALLAALPKNRPIAWLLYALLLVAAVATHYFALFIVMAHYIFFVLHFRRLRPQAIRWFLAMLLVGLLLLPLALFVLNSRNGGTVATVPPWIATIHWYDPLLTVWNFAVGPGIGLENWVGVVGTAVFLLALIPILQQIRRAKKQVTFQQTILVRLLLTWFALPLGFVFLISLNWPFLPQNSFSLYLDRYLIIALPPFLLLVAWGIESLATESREEKEKSSNFSVAKKFARPFFILVAVGCSGLSIWQLSHNPVHWRSDWQAALTVVQQNPGDPTVILGQQDVALPLDYYGSEQLRFVQLPPPDGSTITATFAAAMHQQIETAVQHSPTAWHIEPFYNHDTHQFPAMRQEQMLDESHSMVQTWLKANFPILAQHRLPGLRLTLYDLEMNTRD